MTTNCGAFSTDRYVARGAEILQWLVVLFAKLRGVVTSHAHPWLWKISDQVRARTQSRQHVPCHVLEAKRALTFDAPHSWLFRFTRFSFARLTVQLLHHALRLVFGKTGRSVLWQTRPCATQRTRQLMLVALRGSFAQHKLVDTRGTKTVQAFQNTTIMTIAKAHSTRGRHSCTIHSWDSEDEKAKRVLSEPSRSSPQHYREKLQPAEFQSFIDSLANHQDFWYNKINITTWSGPVP